jgi:hypothetical protein
MDEGVCYKSRMPRPTYRRLAALLLLPVFLTACGGRMINKKTARDAIVGIIPEGLDPDEVDVDSVSQIGSKDAVVETRLKVAFKLENVHGRWVVREIRVGDRPWEPFDQILKALDQVKIVETRRLLEEASRSIAGFVRDNGRVPEFQGFVSLSDALYPGYLKNIIRYDAWQRPFAAVLTGRNRIRMSSMGPDGLAGTADDIELTRTYGPEVASENP